MNDSKILIVEDSALQREMLKRALLSASFVVHTAVNGVEGLDMARELEPDLIISDISMPLMDGYEMCHQVKRQMSVPIILFTQFSDPEDIIRGLVSGADNFVIKPYDTGQLINLIKKTIIESKVIRAEATYKPIEIDINDRRYAISSSRHQILNLLLSTYKSSVAKNSELTTAQIELKSFNEKLEKMVEERTAALMESELRYKSLIESAADGVLITDDETGLIRYGNRVVCDMFGYTGDELNAMYIDQLYDNGSINHSDPFNDSGGRGHGVLQNVRCVRKDGSILYIDFTSTTTTIDGKMHTLSFLKDITDRIDAQERLDRLNKEIKTARQDLNDFSYVMSHDLQTPLRAIVTLADWIETDYSINSEESRERLNMLVGRVRRIHGLIQGILEYSKAGQVRDNNTDVDMNILISDVISMLYSNEGATITIDGPMPVVRCSHTRIEQVFINLLSNAVKFNNRADPKINIGCMDGGDYWRFYVRDNGIGIEGRYFDKIFKIFQTLHGKTDSIGVGLPLAKKIIEMHGGDIWVESEPGAGSTFYFTLPKTTYHDSSR